jgi:hypothetical protein
MRYFAQEDAVFMRCMGIGTALSADAGFHVIQFGSSYQLLIKENNMLSKYLNCPSTHFFTFFFTAKK